MQMLGRDLRHEVVPISARTGEGLERLDAAVSRKLDARSARVQVEVPIADGRTMAAIRRLGAVLEEETVEARCVRMTVRISEAALGNLRRSAPADIEVTVLDRPVEPRVAAEG